MNETSDVRSTVAAAYTAALEQAKTKSGGCCGPKPAGTAAQTAGYGEEARAHGEVLVTSFGCGNPLAFAGVQPGETVLDLGSGAGLDLLIASERVGEGGKVIGVDMTPAMLEQARANVARAGRSNVELRQGFIEALPVEDHSVDWVISNCVINLSPNKTQVFAEIARVLKPGGRFSISDIVAEALPPVITEHPAAYAACVAGAISEANYVAGLEAAGLEEITVTERVVYDADQLRAMVENDLASLGLDAGSFAETFEAVAGKVWSAKITGRARG